MLCVTGCFIYRTPYFLWLSSDTTLLNVINVCFCVAYAWLLPLWRYHLFHCQRQQTSLDKLVVSGYALVLWLIIWSKIKWIPQVKGVNANRGLVIGFTFEWNGSCLYSSSFMQLLQPLEMVVFHTCRSTYPSFLDCRYCKSSRICWEDFNVCNFWTFHSIGIDHPLRKQRLAQLILWTDCCWALR